MARKPNASIFPGAVFSRLTVVKRLPKDTGGYYRALCRCSCGKETTPVIASLINGTSRSCGCLSYAKPGVGYGKIIPGAVFTRLTVIRRLDHEPKALCICDCGTKKAVLLDSLVNGRTKSCGCLNSELRIARNKNTARYRGFSAKFPKTYSAWSGMVSRCYHKNSSPYEFYGAKGVVVCKFLRESPWNFKKLIGVLKVVGHTVDRYPIYNGNYTCGQCKECKVHGWKLNVRWATRKEQALNKGNNVWITAFGRTQTKSQWCEETGLGWKCLTGRLRRGWDVEKALATPSSFKAKV